MRSPMLLLFVATMLVASVAACQPKAADETVTDLTAPTAPAVAVVEPTIEIAPVEVPGDLTVPSAPAEVAQYETLEGGLQYAILQEGTGIDAMTGDSVKVHYTGWLEDGTMFDSSLQPGRGEPIVFQLGTGSVIPGWEMGVLGMKEGEKRQLRIPPDLAYGEAGSGPIPPNSTLIFDVELVAVE